MRRRNIENSHPVILKCAMLITGFSLERFQTKDVLFQVDLVKNLFQSSNHFADFQLQPLQVIRLFEKYAADEWALIFSDKKSKSFQLLPKGLFQILKSLVVLDYILPTAEAIFFQWFLEGYRDFILNRLQGRISCEEHQHLHEITAINFVFKQQIRLIDSGISEIESRIRESDQLQVYLGDCRAKNMNVKETLTAMPDEFSYRLSHQKRFREFMMGLPPEIRQFELDGGIAMRQKNLYRVSHESLVRTKSFYQDVLATAR